MPRTAILIVAAGKGERAGRTRPKQYESVAGKPLLRWSAEAFAGLPVTVVIGPGGQEPSMPAPCRADAFPFTGGAAPPGSGAAWAWKPCKATRPILC